ncbi:MAG: WD40 repeat domain-containing protein [Thiobacillus sp.]|nr:WD40 repeat domain-containing protein [Thiobacillus sp.]
METLARQFLALFKETPIHSSCPRGNNGTRSNERNQWSGAAAFFLSSSLALLSVAMVSPAWAGPGPIADLPIGPGTVVTPAEPGPTVEFSPPGHLLISTANGHLNLFDVQKLRDGDGIGSQTDGIHLCGNQVLYSLSADRTQLYAACGARGPNGTDNASDSMAANNRSISLIDITDIKHMIVKKVVHSGDVANLTFSSPEKISASPNQQIVLVSDWNGVPGTTEGRLLQFDGALNYVQSIPIKGGNISNIEWSTDGLSAFLIASGQVVKIRFAVRPLGSTGLGRPDYRQYRTEYLKSAHYMNAIAHKPIGTTEIFAASSFYGGTVTPILGSTSLSGVSKVLDDRTLAIGNGNPKPFEIKAHPKRNQFYTPNLREGSVSILALSVQANLPTLSLVNNLSVNCQDPQRVAFNSNGSLAFVACNSLISILDAKTGTFLRRTMVALIGGGTTEWIAQ